jgi:flavin-dependent dehydrogenase
MAERRGSETARSSAREVLVTASMYDVAIVGAGTAGAAAAALCAERGLSTICVDRRPLHEAGAHWINGVPASCFPAAGVELPAGHELHASDHVFHLVVGWGPRRLSLRGHGLLDVDMRGLVERLQAQARRAGAELRGEAVVTGFDGHRLSLGADAIEARWFVDASGLAGARLLRQGPVSRHDLCAAAQWVHELADPAGARAWLERQGAHEGETLCFTSVAGGYSIVSVRVEPPRAGEAAAVSLLTGSIPAEGHPSGQRLLDDFVETHPWIGARRAGGARAVPLGRPHDVLAEGNVALLGDAAGQVFSAHGSGIAAGLLAARLLADTLAEGRGPEAYGVRWQRRHGGTFAAYDVFRRFSQGLEIEEVGGLLEAGVLDASSSIAALRQELPRPTLRGLGVQARGLLRSPGLARRLAPVLARMGAAQALYRSYPADSTQRARWSTWAARLLD